MEAGHKIYFVISQTHTKFARLIRKFGKIKYNHVAIALDADLSRLYAFARPQHNAVFLARLVNESTLRYTLGKKNFVDSVVFQVEVTAEKYQWVEETIRQIQADKEYMYNLLSVLTYPVFKGFSTYKAFTCIEFAMYILKGIGINVTKPLYRYRPDDLIDLLGSSIYLKGNLLDFAAKLEIGVDDGYFSPLSYKLIVDSAVAVKELSVRTIFGH